MNIPLLSLLIFTPWVGALLLFVLRRRLSASLGRILPILFSLSTLILGGIVLARFNPVITGMQFTEKHAWITALNVHYHIGLDGLSLVLVLLTGIISPLALFGPTRQVRCPAIHGALFLLLQGSALGVFLALDFFPWFVFWELSLVPAFFLIKLWGGPGAARAAYQFVIYTIGGSAFMLLGFAAIFAETRTFDFLELKLISMGGQAPILFGGAATTWVFLGVLLGLAVKVPLFPFHAWLPPAYAEAPTGTSMFLTSVMSKMGAYGFLRILWPLFPLQFHAAAPILLWLALGGVVLSAFAAMKQTDLKRMVAYSSINHLSYCLLAMCAVATAGPVNPAFPAVMIGTSESGIAALSGTILQLFNHGLSAAALFFCVGVLESRTGGLRGLGDFGGVRTAAPVFAGLCGIALFSSLGLPGLNGFIGEFLIFRGVFGLAPWVAAVATLGLLATALFLLTFWQRVFHGPATGAGVNFRDLDATEIATLGPLIVLMFVLGIFPQLLAGLINPLVTTWAATLP